MRGSDRLEREGTALEVVSRQLEEKEEYWGTLSFSDLEGELPVLLKGIDSLYEYICENTEEVEIERERVVVRVNYLKQSREIQIRLHPMIMFSQDEHCKLKGRFKTLENQVTALRKHKQGSRKLTFRMTLQTVNLTHYSLLDLNQVRPYPRNHELSLLKTLPETQLPLEGTWHFTLVVTEAGIKDRASGPNRNPYFELGIRNDRGERETVRLRTEDEFELG